METDATCATPCDIPPPADKISPQSDNLSHSTSPIPHFNNSNPATDSQSGTTSLARDKQQTLSFVNRAMNANPQVQQQSGSNTNAQGQQKTFSRFLLGMPQLNRRPRSMTQPPSTSAVPGGTLTSSVTMAGPSVQQMAPSWANTSQIRLTQLQMPSLRTPSMPKLPSTRSATTPSQHSGSITPLATTSKPSLQTRMPPESEQSRCTIQSADKTGTRLLTPQHTGSIQFPPPENGVVSQQDGVARSDTPADVISQEVQVVAEQSSQAEIPHQQAHEDMGINQGGGNLDPNLDVITDARGGSSAIPQVQIPQPLPLTAPTQHTSSAAGNGETTNPPTLSNPSLNVLNHTPQETDALGNQEAGAYSVYGRGEICQQSTDGQIHIVSTSLSAKNFQLSQEAQVAEKSSTAEMPHQPTHEDTAINKEGANIDPNLVVTADARGGSSAVPRVQISQSLPVQRSTSTDGNVGPSTHSDNMLNPNMDATGTQEAGAYSIYGGETYQQPSVEEMQIVSTLLHTIKTFLYKHVHVHNLFIAYRRIIHFLVSSLMEELVGSVRLTVSFH